MSDTQRIPTPTQPGTEVQNRSRETQGFLRPPVDVFEDAEGITLSLDMPGVSKDRLNVQADKDALVIEGEMQISMPDGMQALYAEVHSTRYRRSFTLSGELDAEKIEAGLKDGVLTVHIPKRAELRPRKIEVKVV
jgi:HSP20 family molecular chaperone IbpA